MPDVHSLSWSFLSGPYSWGLQKWTNMKTRVRSSFYGELWREKSKSASLKRSSLAPGKTLPWSLKIGSVYKRVFKGATIQLAESQTLCQWVGVSPLKKMGENQGWRESPSLERSFFLSLLWLEGISEEKSWWMTVPQTLGKEEVCRLAGDWFAAVETDHGLFPLVVVVFRSVLTLALQFSNGDSPLVD